MSSSQPQETLQLRIAEAYRQAQAFHHPVALPLDLYQQHLVTLWQQAAGAPAEESSVAAFFARLYSTDLYLTIACWHGENAAWQRLQELYAKVIWETTCLLCQNRAVAEEIAGSTLGHLFLQDGSGACRLASYNGRYQLSTWLRTVVARRVFTEWERPYRHWQPLEELPEVADLSSVTRTEDGIRTRECQAVLEPVIRVAVRQLQERQCLVLLLRYGDGTKVSDIARFLEVTQPTASYYLRQAEKHFRQAIIKQMRVQYDFDEPTISSFLEELRDHPVYALTKHLRAAMER